MSLRVTSLSSGNRESIKNLVFDAHMRLVPASYNMLKIGPLAFLMWTAISTGLLKYRGTHHFNVLEILTVLSGSIIITQAILFVALMFEAASTVPGEGVVGGLDQFLDADSGTEGATSTSSTLKQRKDTTAVTTSDEKKPISASLAASLAKLEKQKKANKFWVLEKSEEPIGCIGAIIVKDEKYAKLVHWTVKRQNRCKGAGSFLLSSAMDQLAKEKGIESVRVVLRGEQISALRIYHKLGFNQVDRVPEWMGERVVLEMKVKEWIKNSAAKK